MHQIKIFGIDFILTYIMVIILTHLNKLIINRLDIKYVKYKNLIDLGFLTAKVILCMINFYICLSFINYYDGFFTCSFMLFFLLMLEGNAYDC